MQQKKAERTVQVSKTIDGVQYRPRIPVSHLKLWEANPEFYITRILHQELSNNQQIGHLWPLWSRQLWAGTKNERMALSIADELVRTLGKTTQVRKITMQTYRDLITKLQAKGNSNATIDNKLASMSKLMNYAIENAIIDSAPKVPFLKRKLPRPRVLTPSEETAILDAMSNALYHNVTKFLLYTAFRKGEAEKLQWRDVEDDRITLWDTKSGRPRSIPLTRQAAEVIAWARLQRDDTGVVFVGYNYSTHVNHWLAAQRAAGIVDRVRIHDLRHTAATRLAQAGMDPLRLQRWLGHSTLQMVSRYTHLNVDDLKEGARALEGDE